MDTSKLSSIVNAWRCDSLPGIDVSDSPGQARLDGAFCDYQAEDKMTFLKKVHSSGVANIEMESLCFASYCHRAGIRGERPSSLKVLVSPMVSFCPGSWSIWFLWTLSWFYVCVCECVHLLISLSLSFSLSVYLSVSLSLSLCLSLSLSLSVSLSLSLFLCLCRSLSLSPSHTHTLMLSLDPLLSLLYIKF